MSDYLRPIASQISAVLKALAADGVDVRAGLAVAGTSPTPEPLVDPAVPVADPQVADPDQDPDTPGYRRPVPYALKTPIAPLRTFLAAISGVRTETLAVSSPHDRQQAQLMAIDQLLSGRGYLGSIGDRFGDAVAPGQTAGWRSAPGTERLLIDVTDQPFDNAEGTPRDGDGKPDVSVVGRELVAQHVGHVGLVAMGFPKAVADLSTLSSATGTLLPPSGLRCGGLTGDELLAGGMPFVCTSTRASLAVGSAVRSLPNPADVRLTATARRDDSLEGLGGRGLPSATWVVNGWSRQRLHTTLDVACPAAARPSTHRVTLTATYRHSTVATRTSTVTCAAAVSLRGPPAPAGLAPALPQPDPGLLPAPAPPGVAAAQPVTQHQLQLGVLMGVQDAPDDQHELASAGSGSSSSDEAAISLTVLTAVAGAGSAAALARSRSQARAVSLAEISSTDRGPRDRP